MFQSKLLKGALCALSFLELSARAAIDPLDISTYAEFA